MIQFSLYMKQGIYHNLVIGDSNERLINMPVYNVDFVIHKGIDNVIQFYVKNHDRVPVIIDEEVYTGFHFTMINQESQEKLTRDLQVINTSKGRYSITLLEKDIVDLQEGKYTGSVYADKSDGTTEFLYTGEDWNPYFEVTVIDNRKDIFKPSITLDPTTFISSLERNPETGIYYNKLISSMVKSDVTPSQTFSITTEHFIGTIKVQGSLETLPTESDDDWFDIDVKVVNEDEVQETETYGVTAELNCLWVRVVIIQDSMYDNPCDKDYGKVKEILYRN